MNNKMQLFIGIAIILCLIVIPPVSSALINGTFYFRNTTPQNDIYEKVVMPRDTIVLGHTYDLTKIEGSSKKFAWWSNDQIEDTTCTPDLIIDISYINSNGKIRPDQVYLDPSLWKVGNWFQWDGCFELPYQRNTDNPQFSVYHQDNNFVFTIIRDPVTPTPQIIYVSAQPTPTPKPTRTTIIPHTTAVPEKQGDWPWWYYPIGIGIGAVIIRIFW